MCGRAGMVFLGGIRTQMGLKDSRGKLMGTLFISFSYFLFPFSSLSSKDISLEVQGERTLWKRGDRSFQALSYSKN